MNACNMAWGIDGLVWLVGLSSLGFVIGLAVTFWLHSGQELDIIVQPVPQPSTDAPAVSVIVPARNEEHNIQRCVQSLLDQSYPNLEVIVVDDRSSDATPRLLAEIAQANQARQAGKARLKIVRGVELPSGWAGKPHALTQGVELARGEWLCFIDADTFAAPFLIASTIQSAEEHGADLFTMLTRQELGSFWEKAILPLVFTALAVGFTPRRVNDPRTPNAIANGQFILIRRSVYDAVGGYPVIRSEIVEDKALAVLVKRRGFRLLIADGRQVARTRMYTRLSEIWEGWTKNIYLGMRDRLGLLLIGALTGLVGALVLPIWLVGGWILFAQTASPLAALVAVQGLLLWAVLIFARWQACRAFGISPLYTFTFPVGAAVFTAMMAASAFKVVSGRGVSWKGRVYP